MLISGTEERYNPFNLPRHPGENDMDLDFKRRERRFQDYLPFIRTDGLNEEEIRFMKYYMEEFYAYTHNKWEPKNCHDCAQSIFRLFTTKALRIPQGYKPLLIYADIDHSWFALANIETNKNIVFDPTGLDRNDVREGISQNYIPFFGVAEYAPFPLNYVYLGGYNYRTISADKPDVKTIYRHDSARKSFNKGVEQYKPILLSGL